MIPKATTRRARWAAVTTMGALLSRGMQSLPNRPHGSTAVDLRRCSAAGAGASKLHQFERFIPGGAATREALEESDPIDPHRHPKVRRLLHEQCPDGRAGRDAVGAGKRQMRTEWTILSHPSDVDQGGIDPRGKVCQLLASVPRAQPERPRSTNRWECPGTADDEVEGLDVRCGDPNG